MPRPCGSPVRRRVAGEIQTSRARRSLDDMPTEPSAEFESERRLREEEAPRLDAGLSLCAVVPQTPHASITAAIGCAGGAEEAGPGRASTRRSGARPPVGGHTRLPPAIFPPERSRPSCQIRKPRNQPPGDPRTLDRGSLRAGRCRRRSGGANANGVLRRVDGHLVREPHQSDTTSADRTAALVLRSGPPVALVVLTRRALPATGALLFLIDERSLGLVAEVASP